MKIAFLGMGAMGSRMATRLLQAGFPVVVWNRSESKTDALKRLGAVVAGTPADAVIEADVVFSMVRDDQASREVWLGSNGALVAMRKDAIGIECSTLSLPYLDTLALAFSVQKIGFIDAPLAGSRPQAEAGQLIFLAGGAVADVERMMPYFMAMGSAVHHAGDTAAGMALKLMVNVLLGTQLAVVGELLGFAKAQGWEIEKMAELLAQIPVTSPAVKAALPAMVGTRFSPSFPIDLVEKDFGMILQSCAPDQLPVTQHTRSVYSAAKSEGFGDDNITGIVQRYLRAVPV